MSCLLFMTNQSGRQCWTLSLFLWGLSTSGPESRSSARKNDSVCSLARVNSEPARTRKGQVWPWLRSKIVSYDGDNLFEFLVWSAEFTSLLPWHLFLLIALWLGLGFCGFQELCTSKGFIRTSSWSCRSRKKIQVIYTQSLQIKSLRTLVIWPWVCWSDELIIYHI